MDTSSFGSSWNVQSSSQVWRRQPSRFVGAAPLQVTIPIPKPQTSEPMPAGVQSLLYQPPLVIDHLPTSPLVEARRKGFQLKAFMFPSSLILWTALIRLFRSIASDVPTRPRSLPSVGESRRSPPYLGEVPPYQQHRHSRIVALSPRLAPAKKSFISSVPHTPASWFSTTSHMSTKAIDITIFGDQRRVAAALPTKFNYVSPLGFVLMCEVAEGCNHFIRDSHRRLHFGDDESPHLSVPKTGHWRRWYLLRILPRRSHSPLPR